jgi:N-acetylglutamate synthase-like GNAT family acetyltransferase
MQSQYQLSVSGALQPDELKNLLQAAGLNVYTLETTAGVITGSSAYVTVRDGPKLIGFGRLLTDGASIAYINNMAVEPAYQNQGIGQQILENLLRIAGNVNQIFLYTNTADRLYLRYGFQLSEKRLYVKKKLG